jgi:opacity protein-like surface antigen
LWGTGLAFAASISDEISVGVSGLVIDGKTDDQEQHTGRGRFTFYGNFFRLDSVYSHVVRSGTSDYDGAEFTFSAMYSGKYVSLGFSVKPPTIITRSYSGQIMVDTTGTPTFTPEKFLDKVRLPWRGTIGLSIAVRENLRLGFEYEIRSYALAEYSNTADSTYSRILKQTHVDSVVSSPNPWLSGSLLHVGIEYSPLTWLVLRAGVRGQAGVFEPEGNPIAEEPVRYSIYSAGFGLRFSGIRLNIAYEYGRMKYQDVWGSAISLNSDSRHTIVADLAYEIPR